MRGAKRYVLLPAEWPLEDRLAWEQATAAGSVLDDGGLAARWKSSTRDTTARGYGRWLRFLKDQDQLSGSIVERTTLEPIAAYIEHLKGQKRPLAPQSIRALVFRLYDALRVMVPAADWKWVRERALVLDPRASRQSDKRIRIQYSARLYHLGISLMEEAMADTTSRPHVRAIQYRDGLAVALLAARPVRRGNLLSIEIGCQLLRVDDVWVLRFEPEETKQRRHYEAPVPAALVPYLERYLEIFRPMFARADQHLGLWACTQGRGMGAQNLYKRICIRTEKAFGRAVNPHLFRDCAATSFALRDPEHVYAAAPLLGHGSLDVTTRHYNQATGLSAVREHQKNISELRKRLPRGKRPKT